ncbi:dixin-like isoform X1 [Mytilus californianus]|uniref:dixin-like isoform X1 n=1 Tax=Mytilus californianus TaxID=6549 RepID=UPI002246A746|nr:dixin-like isoform X1 [Mytilus californianus]
MMDFNSSRNSTHKITGKSENSQNNTLDLRNGVNIVKGNGILNNNHHYNKFVGSKLSDGEKNSINNPESKFSPRVKQGIELKILKPVIYSDVKSATQSYLRSRGTTPSPLATSSAKEQDSDSSSSTLESLQSGNTTSDSGKSVIQKKQQLQAYVAWVNSQLKKKPGVRLIEDLRNDMKDGVAMIELIEIVGGEHMSGVHLCPSTYGEMRENIERILHYMTTNRIRMHHTNPKDIVDGNLKSIMRLILALAAHFKPQSVKHSTQSNSKRSSVTGIAQGASAALAEARRNAAKAGNSFRRNRSSHNYSDRRRTYHEGSSSEHLSDSDQSFNCDRTRVFSRDDGDGASADKSPQSSSRFSPGITDTSSPKESRLSKSKSSDQVYAKDSGTELEDSGSNTVDRAQYEDLLQEYMELSDAMSNTRRELLKLQDLLLCGEPPDGAEDSPKQIISGSSPAEQMVILESQLIQTQEVCSDLREDLSRTKNDCMHLQGKKSGLQQRMADQEEQLSQLRAELLRRDFENQSLESEKGELKMKVYDRDKTISDLRKEIIRRDQKVDQLQNNIQLTIQEKESVTRALKQQISDLHERLRLVGERGATLSARVASQDKRMAKLEGKILQTGDPHQREATPGGNSGEDLHVVRDAIHSLRLNFKTSDPQQHKLDSVEHFVCSLLDKIQQPNNLSTVSNGQNTYEHVTSRRLNFDSTGDVRRSPITSIPGSNPSFSANQLDNPSSRTKQLNPQPTTKVLYFTDRTVNPSMCTIHKRLGEITLKDFKDHISVKGNYRYSFKALDPEFGTVKEEVMSDDDKVPGWEGQIVAWVEEDTG